ncbi:nucleoside-diphosphate sugar epimerase/dehydratase [Aliiglaciecola sp. CAU 1673]|uniref:polysaccharide biosynthesis protein n=1 Tax=Aliiglaciecola sp. CAU 1673 TaxID=3032595 RepID=UPI0023DAC7C6|nr:nucleoside-diphosphate sugar epimerase/dehydratase [Aliiglaciecola sp. CAU 1673]MDF2177978.1 nucleoside-diphosphate sugar epimerase/dehydratase [Aliiglaciecola sp. CAU 1673]
MDSIYNLSKSLKQGGLITVDILLVAFSSYCVVYLYSKGEVPFSVWLTIASVTSIIAIYTYHRVGLYDSVLRFITDDLFRSIIVGTSFVSASFLIVSQFISDSIPVVGSLVFGSIAFLLTSVLRFLLRDYIKSRSTGHYPVIVYGAGSAGRQLVSALHAGDEYKVVAFLDDDKRAQGKRIQGLKIYGISSISRLINEFGVRKVLLAIPSATPKQRKRVISLLEKYPVEVKTVAGAAEIISGSVQITQLRDVAIEDLLGREPVKPVNQLMRECVEDKSVMVTGAGGSIGSELCRQLLLCNPSKLVLFEMSEFALYSIERELRQRLVSLAYDVEIVPILGSVLNKQLLERIMASARVDTVYHAAAYKHVPLVEYNVAEGVQNNVFGTLYCAQAARESGVSHFVLVSTDKAVRPTNFMGATKRTAELVLQAMALENSQTKFSMVRFGNVLGSSGSVVPLFKEQIESGGPVTVTHKDITRYFMTIPEASQLVIQAGAMTKGGDVFVLDMGEPVRIADLAEKMIHLMGFKVKDPNLGGDGIEIVYTGLRPGEKLYEELLVGTDVEGTIHPRIMTANEVSVSLHDLSLKLEQLLAACEINDCNRIRDIFFSLPIEFSHKKISDYLWDDDLQTIPRRVGNVVTINTQG